jgi:hypothetical protein
VLGIVYYTYVGETPSVEARTKVLHEVLDGGGLDEFGWGSVEVRLSSLLFFHFPPSFLPPL